MKRSWSTPLPENTSITISKNDADKPVSFGDITFTNAGKYVYVVKETTKSADGIECDSKDHKVTINIKNNNGCLEAAIGSSLIQTEPFENTYSAKGEGEIKVKKNLEGREWTDNDINYETSTKSIGQRPVTVDFMGILRYGDVSLYCKYSPMSVLKSKSENGVENPQFHSMTFGLFF